MLPRIKNGIAPLRNSLILSHAVFDELINEGIFKEGISRIKPIGLEINFDKIFPFSEIISNTQRNTIAAQIGPVNAAVKANITAMRAEHGINGIRAAATILSYLFSNIRVAYIAGTEHPKPSRNGIADLPCSPIL